MSDMLAAIQLLVKRADVIVSAHGEKELANDAIDLFDLMHTIDAATVVEDYPMYAKGACVLVLQHDSTGEVIHALWGVRKGTVRPAVLITAYRPDPAQWSADFLTRLP